MLSNILVYVCLVFRTAWGHSASLARNIIFYAVVIIGAGAFLVPIIGMTIDASGLLSLLSNPKFGFGLFGAIVMSRLFCAPYWIWREQCNTISEMEDAISINELKLQTIRAELKKCYIKQQELYVASASLDNLQQWLKEIEEYINSTSDWICHNIGNAARARFMDMSGQSYIYTTKNAERNSAMNLLTKSGINLKELIEHLDAYIEL